MNESCEIVRDLLPLYADEVCSPASRIVVEAHLETCPECKALLAELRSPGIENRLEEEKHSAVEARKKAFRKKKEKLALILSGVLLVPLLVCLPVNLLTGGELGLDWFFIVLASVLLFASLTVVPLLATKYRLLLQFGAFDISYTFLLAVCCLYTGGRRFWIVFCSTLLGWCAAELPILFRAEPLCRYLKKGRGALILTAVDLSFLLLTASVAAYSGRKTEVWFSVYVYALPCIVFGWIVYLLFRFGPKNKRIRTGLAVLLAGVAGFFAKTCFRMLAGGSFRFPLLRLNDWVGSAVDDNLAWILLFAGVLIGSALILNGIQRDTQE